MANHEYVTIANGTSLSPEFSLRGFRIVGIKFPAAWTAADLTFQASEIPTAEGGVYGNVFATDDAGTGAEVVVDAAASQVTVPDTTNSWPADCMVKIRSGTAGTPVNQGAARIVTLLLVHTPGH